MDRDRAVPDTRPGPPDGTSVLRRSTLSLPATLTRTPRTGETPPTTTHSVYAPPSDPRDPSAPTSTPTGLRSLVAALLLAAVVPAALFVATRPVVGAVGLAALVGLSAGARRGARSLRRLRRDHLLRVDLPGGLVLRVARHPAETHREEPSTEV